MENVNGGYNTERNYKHKIDLAQLQLNLKLNSSKVMNRRKKSFIRSKISKYQMIS